jgi:transcriptional regulator PpsR
VVVVDAVSRKVMEANPAAERLIGAPGSALVGQIFADAFDGASRDHVTALLARAYSGSNLTAQADVVSGGRVFTLAVSLFRQDRTSFFLARLAARDTEISAPPMESSRRLVDVLERMPDAFVVADEDLRILACNGAFLDLSALATAEQAQGQPIDVFLGRPDMDRNILISSLRQHGVLKNFATVARNRLGAQEDVEVSAVHVAAGDQPCFGFSIRRAARSASKPRLVGEPPRTVEQLSQLVGRMTLKQLVRESTDLVERLCIEAALEMTGNNRASAAELLGLSRQSLYSKLHRYGLAGADQDA